MISMPVSVCNFEVLSIFLSCTRSFSLPLLPKQLFQRTRYNRYHANPTPNILERIISFTLISILMLWLFNIIINFVTPSKLSSLILCMSNTLFYKIFASFSYIYSHVPRFHFYIRSRPRWLKDHQVDSCQIISSYGLSSKSKKKKKGNENIPIFRTYSGDEHKNSMEGYIIS